MVLSTILNVLFGRDAPDHVEQAAGFKMGFTVLYGSWKRDYKLVSALVCWDCQIELQRLDLEFL